MRVYKQLQQRLLVSCSLELKKIFQNKNFWLWGNDIRYRLSFEQPCYKKAAQQALDMYTVSYISGDFKTPNDLLEMLRMPENPH